jgi:hypothetical protein
LFAMSPFFLLLMRKPQFISVFHITCMATSLVREGTTAWQIYTGTQEFRLGVLIYSIIFYIVFFLLWRLYYTRSVRVRTYMCTDTYITQCPFTRRVVPPQPAVPDTHEVHRETANL